MADSASTSDIEQEKERAARAAADLIDDGATVGLGTGSTVAHFLPALAARRLSIRCVATSPQTERAARDLGLRVDPFDLVRLDVAVDGADQVDPQGWLVKGGGGAHTREKIVAAAAARFIVIVDSSKVTSRLGPPIPLELSRFGLASTLARLGDVQLRDAPATPDDGVLADFTGEVDDPATLAAELAAAPGVVDHGLFPPEMVSVILVGQGDGVARTDLDRA